ncbi:MAG: glycosyltransferase [Propionibacteriaceae bacterium]|nr:glycosyltransferase [Propionibacteriaceae bacterium]
MSRVVFLAIGSRGDVLPMVATARELADRGVQTMVLSHPEYTGIAEAQSIPVVSLGAGLVEHADDQRRAQSLIGNPVLAALGLQAWQRRIASTLALVLLEHIRSDDVLITGVVGVPAALALAEERGCHVVHVTFSATLPTAGPMAMMSPRTTRPSRLIGWWTRHGVWTGSLSLGQPLEREVRRRLRLPWRSPWAVAGRALQMPVLIAASRLLLPPQPDWPVNTMVTGAWELGGEPTPPGTELVESLGNGPAPVYVGFGSMLSRDPAKDLLLIDEAAARAGVAVVHRPDDSSGPLESTSMVRVVRDVDHRWLFPRCAGVIHHGGAGTTNAALAAGVPSAIISHGFDQPFHGRRLHEMGVGPEPLTRRRLTAEKLAGLLKEMMHGPQHESYRRTADAVGRQVRAERGTATAADWLEKRGLLD